MTMIIDVATVTTITIRTGTMIAGGITNATSSGNVSTMAGGTGIMIATIGVGVIATTATTIAAGQVTPVAGTVIPAAVTAATDTLVAATAAMDIQAAVTTEIMATASDTRMVSTRPARTWPSISRLTPTRAATVAGPMGTRDMAISMPIGRSTPAATALDMNPISAADIADGASKYLDLIWIWAAGCSGGFFLTARLFARKFFSAANFFS